MRFGVTSRKEKELASKMERLCIREEDLVEKFIRPSGPGGRKADNTSSCVYIKHVPTGTEVKCSRQRSRSVNRYLARRMLAEKIEEVVSGEKAALKREAEKIKRQKRKRSRRAKEKILKAKKEVSQKKEMRRGPLSLD